MGEGSFTAVFIAKKWKNSYDSLMNIWDLVKKQQIAIFLSIAYNINVKKVKKTKHLFVKG